MVIDQKFRAFEIAGRNADIVFSALVVELSETPVNQPKLPGALAYIPKLRARSTNLSFLVINHDVMWLDIAVHDALAVAEIKCLEQLVHVVADVIILEPRIQRPEVGIINALKYEAGRLALAISDHI